MNKKATRFFAVMLVIIAVLSVSAPAFAEFGSDEPQRASAYITSVYAHTLVSNGTVNVYFAITATDIMDSLGATDILVYDSHNYLVAWKSTSNTTGLMGSNDYYYSNTISCCSAASGERYYAIVAYRAEDSTGYDTTSYLTNYAP